MAQVLCKPLHEFSDHEFESQYLKLIFILYYKKNLKTDVDMKSLLKITNISTEMSENESENLAKLLMNIFLIIFKTNDQKLF